MVLLVLLVVGGLVGAHTFKYKQSSDCASRPMLSNFSYQGALMQSGPNCVAFLAPDQGGTADGGWNRCCVPYWMPRARRKLIEVSLAPNVGIMVR